MTALEVRDLIKAGKTTALILGGGMEENGPYLILGKHNTESLAMGEAIARKLGNTLYCSGSDHSEPGNPRKPSTPWRRGPPVHRHLYERPVPTWRRPESNGL